MSDTFVVWKGSEDWELFSSSVQTLASASDDTRSGTSWNVQRA